MVRYLAKKGNAGIFLSKTEQINQMLEKGFEIYEVYNDGSENLIATPGMDIRSRNALPQIEHTESVSLL